MYSGILRSFWGGLSHSCRVRHASALQVRLLSKRVLEKARVGAAKEASTKHEFTGFRVGGGQIPNDLAGVLAASSTGLL